MLNYRVITKMWSWLRLGVILLLLGVITACASMTEQECLTANWFDRGYRDGLNGETVRRLADHYEACAKVGVSPNQTLYHTGRNQGLTHYCTPSNGLDRGRQGQSYQNVCPAHLEGAFLRAYYEGKRVYEAERKTDELYRRLSGLESELEQANSDDQRQQLRRRIRQTDLDLRRARDEMHSLERRSRYGVF